MPSTFVVWVTSCVSLPCYLHGYLTISIKVTFAQSPCILAGIKINSLRPLVMPKLHSVTVENTIPQHRDTTRSSSIQGHLENHLVFIRYLGVTTIIILPDVPSGPVVSVAGPSVLQSSREIT